jgi:hypothetical protein
LQRGRPACVQILWGERRGDYIYRLAFDLALPTENAGSTALVTPDREEAWARRLFEKAVLGFARVELEPLGWSVRGGTPLEWQISSASEGLPKILPRMVTDIVLDPPNAGQRLVIDTKFTSLLPTVIRNELRGLLREHAAEPIYRAARGSW